MRKQSRAYGECRRDLWLACSVPHIAYSLAGRCHIEVSHSVRVVGSGLLDISKVRRRQLSLRSKFYHLQSDKVASYVAHGERVICQRYCGAK